MSGGTSPSSSRAYRRSVRLVRAWASLYTRGLDADEAAERREELDSDLWEQGADADRDGRRPGALAASVLSRALRGIADDLSWRRSRIAAGAVVPEAVEWRSDRGLAAAGLVGFVTFALGATALARVVVGAARGELPPSALTIAMTAAGAILAAVALVLLVERRARWVSALVAGLASALVLPYASLALVTLSATAQFAYFRVLLVPGWQTAATLVAIAVPLFHVCLAFAWYPSRRSVR